MCDAIGERNAKIDFGPPDRYTSNVADQPQTSGRLSAGMCPGLVDVVLMRIPPVLLLLCGLLFVSTVRGDDWPQWMGPGRDGVWRETGTLERFPQAGPRVLWRTPIAAGYAGPSVAGERVFVMDFVTPDGRGTNNPGARDKLSGVERLLCLDRDTGREVWKIETQVDYNISYAGGPRVTPTVAGDLVYSLGAEGDLLCARVADGSMVWRKDLNDTYKCETPWWGFCGHPLVDGDKLLCLAGGVGSIAIALDRHTGTELWKSLTASDPGYCPPSIIEHAGRRQLLIWTADDLNGLDPETGKVLWTHPLAPKYKMSINIPQKSGDLLFASGIGKVAAALRFNEQGTAVSEVWKGTTTTGVYCANATPLIADGVIYGCDCDSGHLRAVDLKTGKRLWESLKATTNDRPAPHATAFLVRHGDTGNKWVLFNERGELILARLTPQGYEELSRAKVLEATGDAFGRPVVWTHPAFANRCVFVRNDREIVCVSLAAE